MWERDSELVGVDLRVEKQLELVRRFQSRFGTEYEELPRKSFSRPGEFHLENDLFGWLDAVIYYCMLREFKPGRVIEVGSGLSTLLAIGVLERNGADGAEGRITAIDPYPRPDLLPRPAERAELLVEMAQDVPVSRFEVLDANDVLFIDSSHVLKIGSDVHYLYLEVIPRLKPGVLVHAHDIFLPSEYPENGSKSTNASGTSSTCSRLSSPSTGRSMFSGAEAFCTATTPTSSMQPFRSTSPPTVRLGASGSGELRSGGTRSPRRVRRRRGGGRRAPGRDPRP